MTHPAGYRLSVPNGIEGSLRAPASKSYTNRALVLSALAQGSSRVLHPLLSDDTERMEECLRAMGARIRRDDDAWTVTGTSGHPASPKETLNAGLSGTTMRFLAAVLCLTPEGGSVSGLPGLLHRPIGDLSEALRQLGASVRDQHGLPPVEVLRGRLRGGSVMVEAARSSQFATAVLMVAPCAETDCDVSITNLSNPGYVEMTLDSMRGWGARFERRADGSVHIPGGQTYRASDVEVEFDASAAMHLFALAMATGGTVTVENATRSTKQPDAGLLHVFERMGGRVTSGPAGITLRGPERPVACEADLGAMPDQVPTLAALAAVAGGTTVISNVAMVRGHETDRLAAVTAELRRLGVAVQELPDGLRIQGNERLQPASVRTYGDHRMAMAFAALAGRAPNLVIEDPGCVSKTYPEFWEDAQRLGLVELAVK